VVTGVHTRLNSLQIKRKLLGVYRRYLEVGGVIVVAIIANRKLDKFLKFAAVNFDGYAVAALMTNGAYYCRYVFHYVRLKKFNKASAQP
jgi:hypothetical protein